MNTTTATTALQIAAELDLDARLLDAADSHTCPGFRLFKVTANGAEYLMAADRADGIGTRLYFRAGINDATVPVTVEEVGTNPDADAWSAARGLI